MSYKNVEEEWLSMPERRQTTRAGGSETGSAHLEITLQHARDISEIRSDVAGMKVGIESLSASQDAGFRGVVHQLDVMHKNLANANAPKPPVNYWGAGSLLLGCLAALGGLIVFFFSLSMDRMHDESARVQRETDLRFETSHNNIEEIRNSLSSSRKDDYESAYSRGMLEERVNNMKDRVDAVVDDQYARREGEHGR